MSSQDIAYKESLYFNNFMPILMMNNEKLLVSLQRMTLKWLHRMTLQYILFFYDSLVKLIKEHRVLTGQTIQESERIFLQCCHLEKKCCLSATTLE